MVDEKASTLEDPVRDQEGEGLKSKSTQRRLDSLHAAPRKPAPTALGGRRANKAGAFGKFQGPRRSLRDQAGLDPSPAASVLNNWLVSKVYNKQTNEDRCVRFPAPPPPRLPLGRLRYP